ncbi:MAG: tRNA uridine-5-carboxymethylaminomethyl(34) synthesis enzyme MnmG [Phycisphaerales bacterium]|nr:tRNA uridine-5-carboxymethylaminomethyl(34) synthesis enzyme MnmG [Phycisphaerales bacterium]
MNNDYDIIVIGGGHAGAEAAWAAARMGCRTALVTMQIEAIGRMSCNPAIGGLGKGQMVREIDALGGLMALATDEGGIQFRMLNRSKGPAVWAPRAQADRALYAATVQRMLRETDHLDLIEATAEELLVEESTALPTRNASEGQELTERKTRIVGVRLHDGRVICCRAAILTTGTFLRGLMHCGEEKIVGGRIGEPAAVNLSASLDKLGFTLARLKTGTPPRVHRDSVDFTHLQPQAGDNPPVPFSFMTPRITQRQVECWIAHTNEHTHDIIRGNLARAPMYSGQIKSRGPRYCPSIEDKVVRFADKQSHQVFLEPEGYDDSWMYCNGIPTSLPRDVQDALVHSIPGLEKAEIVQYGYAIEYDWVPTDQISSTLESKPVAGLYLAGQINGTSGYEEAAAQGLLAAINAVARLKGTEPVVLGRDQSYIGVMIDDIVTRPPDEPYRMFTSRAEYRLHLRSDNADARLTPIGRRVGLVDDQRWGQFQQKQAAIAELRALLRETHLEGRSLQEWLRRPEVRLRDLASQIPALNMALYATAVSDAVEIDARYAGYLEREQRVIQRYRQMETKLIPAGFDYAAMPELRREAREKFARVQPRSVGQAARISGISPADIATLSIYLARHHRESAG